MNAKPLITYTMSDANGKLLGEFRVLQTAIDGGLIDILRKNSPLCTIKLKDQ